MFSFHSDVTHSRKVSFSKSFSFNSNGEGHEFLLNIFMT